MVALPGIAIVGFWRGRIAGRKMRENKEIPRVSGMGREGAYVCKYNIIQQYIAWCCMEYQTYAQAGKGKPQDCARAALRSKTGVISGGMLSQVVSRMWAW